MSNYCAAYLVEQMRAFPGWSEAPDPTMSGGDVVYLHDDLVVTRGVFRDEQVVFTAVTDAWRQFCRDALEFHVPDYCQPR